MATHLQLSILITFFIFLSSSTLTSTFSLLPQPTLQHQEELSSYSIPPTPTPHLLHTQLAPILSNLGFQELSIAAPSLTDSSLPSWTGPATIFAPSDESIHTCPYCSTFSLLKEHMVPGLFPSTYLAKIVSGVKLETMNPGRCITLTTSQENSSKIFIDGVELTHPDLYNDGTLVIHGLQGFVIPLSPSSCNSISLNDNRASPPPSPPSPSFAIRLMLRDAIFRLRENGYGVLSLALRVKYGELVNLQNMTIFALQDSSIFSGGYSYVNNVRFHIVPNRYLMRADLMRLPSGASLETLVHGESLVVTNGGNSGGGLRINYVPLRSADVLYNQKIVVHAIFWPFPHMHSSMFPSAVGLNATQSCAVDAMGTERCDQAPPAATEDEGF